MKKTPKESPDQVRKQTEAPEVKKKVLSPEEQEALAIKKAEEQVELLKKHYEEFDAKLKIKKEALKKAKGKKAKEKAKREVDEAEQLLKMMHDDLEKIKHNASKARQSKLQRLLDEAKIEEGPFREIIQKKVDKINGFRKRIDKKRIRRDELRRKVFFGNEQDIIRQSKENTKQINKLDYDIQDLRRRETAEMIGLKKDYENLRVYEAKTQRRKIALEAEERAAKGITPEKYEWLRKRAKPRSEKKKEIQSAKKDAIYDTDIEGTPNADHIVSMHEITKMEGFSRLHPKDQVEILRMDENFMALDGRVNSSKNDASFKDWPGFVHPDFGEIPKQKRDHFIDLENSLRAKIEAKIKQLDPVNQKK